MGVTIRCKITGSSINMSYIGFQLLRRKVAEMHSREFEKHYSLACSPQVMILKAKLSEDYFREHSRITAEMMENKQIHPKIVDFCYQSDCDGSVRYGACKVIYDIIKDYDDDVLYGYSGRPDCAKFADFKAIVKECCDTKSDLVWS
ncbi:MAG: hypothetical protein LBJ84_07440 [Oscillospiraceae bacterium]|jgi:hypothetical protein|nr:hypothetical protein [Oscillospiraceae bacterium]